MPDVIETERLRLRPFADDLSDLDALHEIRSDPEDTRFYACARVDFEAAQDMSYVHSPSTVGQADGSAVSRVNGGDVLPGGPHPVCLGRSQLKGPRTSNV